MLVSRLSGCFASCAAWNSELEYAAASASHLVTLTSAPSRSTTLDVGAITLRICDGLLDLDGGPAASRIGGGRPMMGQLSQWDDVQHWISALHLDESICVDELFLLKNSHQKPRKRMSGFLNQRNNNTFKHAHFMDHVNHVAMIVLLHANTGNTHRLCEK